MTPLVLQKELLYDYYGDSPDDISNILNDYLVSHPATIDSLRLAFATGMEDLRRCIHFHSSAFAYVGFPQLHADCSAFGQRCKQTDNTDDVRQEFETLVARITESSRLVKLELQQPAAVDA